MLPSRERALAGLNYEPAEAKEYKAMIDEQTQKNKEKVEVEAWTMIAGKCTQLKVKYRGDQVIVCVADTAPSTDVGKLTQVVRDFYEYIDLAKTALLKKASSGTQPKVAMSATAEVKKSVHGSVRGGRQGGSSKPDADKGLETIGMEYNNAIYKDRVIAIFAYAKKKAADTTIPEKERDTINTREIIDKVFTPIYKGQNAKASIRNKTSSTLRYMNNKGWIKKVGEGVARTAIYAIIENPFESEMPAQAEPVDTDYIRKSKEQALQMYREQ